MNRTDRHPAAGARSASEQMQVSQRRQVLSFFRGFTVWLFYAPAGFAVIAPLFGSIPMNSSARRGPTLIGIEMRGRRTETKSAPVDVADVSLSG